MFNPGDTIIFDPSTFDQEFWENLPKKDKIKYYRKYGFGEPKMKLFTFICELSPQKRHCLVVEICHPPVFHTMVHMSEFRLATDDEC